MINNRQNGRRRGRGGGPRTPNAPGNGNRQDNRSRGNAAQLLEKYKSLARDAQLAGDRVQTEYYLQFADHYFRVLNENRSRFEDQQRRGRDDFASDEDEGEEEGVIAAEGEEQDEGEASRPPERSAEDEQQPQRGDHRNGEQRPRRQQRRRRGGEGEGESAEAEGQAGEERIAIESLPPAISVIEGSGEDGQRAPRRRGRRPRSEGDEAEIAPAA